DVVKGQGFWYRGADHTVPAILEQLKKRSVKRNGCRRLLGMKQRLQTRNQSVDWSYVRPQRSMLVTKARTTQGQDSSDVEGS
ncbi:MAG TPA: hypothetical protein VKV02_05940, partial [Acidobacteriaceae bacterium]|nr:hypothetical protein [Acidobacteriaceae bacterium]